MRYDFHSMHPVNEYALKLKFFPDFFYRCIEKSRKQSVEEVKRMFLYYRIKTEGKAKVVAAGWGT